MKQRSTEHERSIAESPHGASLTCSRLPRLIVNAGEEASRRFVEFFAGTIRNHNTRAAYLQGVQQFFAWCDKHRFHSLDQIEPLVVAAYIEQHPGAKPTVKQHLAALRHLFDWLVIGQIMPHNPASAVRGPSYSVRRGKTPVLSPEEARRLLDSIDTSTVIGLRDRAIIGVMLFSFARVSAVVGMRVEDYFRERNRGWLRLQEKGGKRHEVPAHHSVEQYLDEYLVAAGIGADESSPLFRSCDRRGLLTDKPLTRSDTLRMIKRRAIPAGLPPGICCHSFRATGITVFIERGGTIEAAQRIAAHVSPRTTQLYDRTEDEITLVEIEKITL